MSISTSADRDHRRSATLRSLCARQDALPYDYLRLLDFCELRIERALADRRPGETFEESIAADVVLAVLAREVALHDERVTEIEEYPLNVEIG